MAWGSSKLVRTAARSVADLARGLAVTSSALAAFGTPRSGAQGERLMPMGFLRGFPSPVPDRRKRWTGGRDHDVLKKRGGEGGWIRVTRNREKTREAQEQRGARACLP